MPIVTIQQSSGRSVEQKRELTARITQAFAEIYQVAPESVTVFFQDYEADAWGKGGKLHADRTPAR